MTEKILTVYTSQDRVAKVTYHKWHAWSITEGRLTILYNADKVGMNREVFAPNGWFGIRIEPDHDS